MHVRVHILYIFVRGNGNGDYNGDRNGESDWNGNVTVIVRRRWGEVARVGGQWGSCEVTSANAYEPSITTALQSWKSVL